MMDGTGPSSDSGPAFPLGALLVHTRKRAELTQEGLAERAGVSVNTISNLEAGRGHLPRQATIDLLVSALARELALAPAEQADLRAAFREAIGITRERQQAGASAGPAARAEAPDSPPLPAGTLTFLVCAPVPTAMGRPDLPPATHAALPRLAAMLQQVVPARGGRLLDPPDGPDGAVCVFPRADEALAAACALRQALWARPAPPSVAAEDAAPAEVSVCLALHAGWAEPGTGDYAGPTRRRAARLAHLGHGGQLLLLPPTEALMRGALPEGVRLLGVGQHRLSAVERPQPVYQVLQPGLPAGFPPLRAAQAPPTNLPVQLTSFIGREQEHAAIGGLLGRAPLVTLVGAGGCGKTRLALQVGAEALEEYPDGVWLVELAALRDGALAPQAVAAALGLREEPGRPLLATLTDHLHTRRLLLVLDNCEQILAACAELAAALLRRCPYLHLLATSRERLSIGGEVSYRVPSLAVPAPDQHPTAVKLTGYEAVQLFAERARAGQPDFTLSEGNAGLVAHICRQLDGIPLAIELAAARVGSMPLEAIAERLEQSLAVLTDGPRDVLPRHRTLRAALDWSWELLGEPEQALLRRLSVFAGGWGIEAAEAICAGVGTGTGGWPVLGLLGRLVGKSLVILAESGDAGRYGLLEVVRQYAAERLAASGEEAAVRDRHLAHFLALVEEAAPRLLGPEQGAWLGRLEMEHDNLRAALGWARARGKGDLGLRLAAALWRFWEIRGHFGEGQHWLEVALAGGAEHPLALRAQVLHGAGRLAFQQDDYERAAALLEEALALRRGLGDRQGIASSLHSLAIVANLQSAYGRAAALYQEALALRRELGDTWGSAESLNGLGTVAYEQGDYGRAATLYQESVALFREAGDRRGLASSLNNLGTVVAERGEYGRAAALYEEALALYRALNDRQGIATVLDSLGTMAYERGEYGRAAALYQEALALRRDLGDRQGIALSLSGLGYVAHERGEYERAAALHQEALLLSRDMGTQDLAEDLLEALALVAGAQGQARRAAHLGGAAEALREALGVPLAPKQRDRHERAVQIARSALGEQVYAAAWAEGRALSLEQAIALALA